MFGISHLAAMLTAPFFAANTTKLGAKTVLIVGSFLQCLFGGILFALLDEVNGTAAFLGLSYLLRFVFGIGNAGAFCAALGIVISHFPSKATTLVAMLETFFGLGYLIGPAIGSLLYAEGGFQASDRSVIYGEGSSRTICNKCLNYTRILQRRTASITPLFLINLRISRILKPLAQAIVRTKLRSANRINYFPSQLPFLVVGGVSMVFAFMSFFVPGGKEGEEEGEGGRRRTPSGRMPFGSRPLKLWDVITVTIEIFLKKIF